MLRALRLPAAAATLTLVGLAGTTVAHADSTSEGEILNPTEGAEVGQTAVQTITMDMEVSGDGQSLSMTIEMSADAEIIEVTEDGGYTMQQVITSIEQTAGDAAGQAGVDQMQPLVGVTMTQEIGADGTPGDVELAEGSPAEAAMLLEQFGTSISGSPLAFPEEAVAVGDDWENEVTTETGGVELTVVYHYELLELDDEAFTVAVEYSTDIDEAGATGTTSGEGTITGVRGQPLLIDSDIDTTTSVEGGGVELSQDINLTLDAEPRA